MCSSGAISTVDDVDTIHRGNAAEAAVLHHLVLADIHVLVPFGGGLPFDLGAVAPPDGRILRIQVKSGRVRGDCVAFNSCSTDHGLGRQNYRGRADLIAVYVRELDRVFMLPADECPNFVGLLRLRPARNNQRRGIRFAADHTLERWIERITGYRTADAPRPDLRHPPAEAPQAAAR